VSGDIFNHPDIVLVQCQQCAWERQVKPDYDVPNGLWHARAALINEHRVHVAQEHRLLPRITHLLDKGAGHE